MIVIVKYDAFHSGKSGGGLIVCATQEKPKEFVAHDWNVGTYYGP